MTKGERKRELKTVKQIGNKGKKAKMQKLRKIVMDRMMMLGEASRELMWDWQIKDTVRLEVEGKMKIKMKMKAEGKIDNEMSREMMLESLMDKQKKEMKEIEVMGLKEREKMDHMDLKSYFFPCVPTARWNEQVLLDYFDGNFSDNLEDDPLGSHVIDVSEKLEKEWRDQVIGLPVPESATATKIEVGSLYDIKPLLFSSPEKDFLIRTGSSGSKFTSDDLNSLKCVMICCFQVPFIWNNSDVWLAALACDELYTEIPDFEMVIVAKMRQGWAHDEASFNHFLSGFPPNCLAVPFHDQHRRDQICHLLGLDGRASRVLLVDSITDEVLLHFELDALDPLDLVSRYPIPGDYRTFPCARDHLPSKSSSSENFCSVPVYNPSSLEDYVGFNNTCVFPFRKIRISDESGPLSFVRETVPISQLNSKLVGLYLYSSGELLPLLRRVSEACKQQSKEFEIVVMYVPPLEFEQDPRLFPEHFSNVLAKLNLINWWVVPYNYSASMRLQNLFHKDKVVIFRPNGRRGDKRGAEVMQIFGGRIDAYPFTVECVAQRTLSEMRKLTIDSFFPSLPSCRLMGRKALLYFDFPQHINETLFDEFCNLSKMMSKEDPDLAVFCFNLFKDGPQCCATGEQRIDADLLDSADCYLTERSWLCADDAFKNFFRRFFGRRFATVVAFGKDGRICSLLAYPHVSSSCEASPFDDDPLGQVELVCSDSIDYHDRGLLNFNVSV